MAGVIRMLVVENGPEPRLSRLLAAEPYELVTVSSCGTAGAEAADGLPAVDLIVADLAGTATGTGSFSTVGSDRIAGWFEPPRAHRSEDERPRAPALLVVTAAQLAAIARQAWTGDFLVAGEDAFAAAEELRLRVRRMARQQLPHKTELAIRVRGLVIDPTAHEVRIDEQLIELTYQEFLLLAFLAGHPGKVFSRQQLLTRVWGYNDIGGTRTVDIHVRRIRAKLGPTWGACVQTVRQVGYKFQDNDNAQDRDQGQETIRDGEP